MFKAESGGGLLRSEEGKFCRFSSSVVWDLLKCWPGKQGLVSMRLSSSPRHRRTGRAGGELSTGPARQSIGSYQKRMKGAVLYFFVLIFLF